MVLQTKWCIILKPRCCLTILYADIWCRLTGRVSITLLKIGTDSPYLGLGYTTNKEISIEYISPRLP